MRPTIDLDRNLNSDYIKGLNEAIRLVMDLYLHAREHGVEDPEYLKMASRLIRLLTTMRADLYDRGVTAVLPKAG